MRHLIKFQFIIFICVILFSCETKKNQNENINMEVSIPELSKLNDSIAKFPKNASLYNLRAKYYIENKNLDSATIDIKRALSIDTTQAVFYVTLSDVFFAMGQITNCKSALEKALYIEPNLIDAILKTAEIHLYYREYQRSLEFIDRAIKVEENYAKPYFMKGMVFKELGDTAKATSNFQIATEKKEDYYEPFMQLGLIFSAKKNKLAIDYFNSALNIKPRSLETMYGLGMYYQNNQEYNKAIETYTNMLKIDPNYAYAHYNLGYIHLVYLQIYDVAAKHFTNAINANPQYPEAYYNRGYCKELLGDIFNAKADYQVALQLRPQYQRAIEGINRVEKISKH